MSKCAVLRTASINTTPKCAVLRMASINPTPKCAVVRMRNLYFSEKRTPHASVLTIITVLPTVASLMLAKPKQ